MDRSTRALLAIVVPSALAMVAAASLCAGGGSPPVWAELPSFDAVEDEPVTVDLSPYVGDPDTPLHDLWLECAQPGSSIDWFCVTVTLHIGGINILRMFLSDGNSTTMAELVVIVRDVNDPPRLKMVQLPDAVADELYCFNLTATDEDDAREALRFSDDAPFFDIREDGCIAFVPVHRDRGYHTFNVTVRDPHGASDTDEFTLYISGEDPPYIPYIPPLYDAYVGEPFVLDIEPNFPDLLLPPEFQPEYTWSIDSPKFVVNQTEARFVWDRPTGPDVGDHYFKIRVQDDRGRYMEQAVKVTVYDLVPPVAEAGDNVTIRQGEAVRLDGGRSSDDGGLVRWEWSCSFGGTVRTFKREVLVLALDVAGAFVFTLQVEDWGGNLANDTVTVRVLDGEPPVAVATQSGPILMHGRVYLDGTASSDNVGIVMYRWTLLENGSVLELHSPTARVVLDAAGNRTVRLEVTDAAGLSSATELVVVVLDTERPRADAGRDVVTRRGYLVELDGGASTDNVGVVSYAWEVVGPGKPLHLVGEHPCVVLDRPGTYSVRLTVTDPMGNEGTDTVLIDVVPEERSSALEVPVPLQEVLLPLSMMGVLVGLILARRRMSR